MSLEYGFPEKSLHRAGAAGAVDDLDRLVGWENEDLAVADVAFRACPGNTDNGVERPFQEIIVDNYFKYNLAQQLSGILVTAIHFSPAALPAETLGIGNCHPRNLDFLQGFAYRAEFGRLDDGNDKFHAVFPVGFLVGGTRRVPHPQTECVG